jgi:hypothetical protein
MKQNNRLVFSFSYLCASASLPVVCSVVMQQIKEERCLQTNVDVLTTCKCRRIRFLGSASRTSAQVPHITHGNHCK